MDILPIQGSAVPCERVFSSAKETMSPRRNRVGPKLMEALQMLKFSHRNGGGGCDLDFTSGTSRQAEIEALEGQCSGIVQVPDDYTTYINSLVADLLEESDVDDLDEEDMFEDEEDA